MRKQMDEKELQYDELKKRFRKWRMINKWIDRILLSVLIFLMIFAGSGLIDGLMLIGEGSGGVRYHSFSQLRKINPDIAGWLTMSGTRIDHPVVRSNDNFDYLDKGFDGRFYAGGTLFLDKDNSSFEDPYCIVHGHNMTGGAMFGDLDKYLDPAFFEKNSTGTLMTPEYDYDLKVLASGVFDAYDRCVFNAGGAVPSGYVAENAMNTRMDSEPEHILALSTCFDDMTDNRTVVFCALVNRRKHR